MTFRLKCSPVKLSVSSGPTAAARGTLLNLIAGTTPVSGGTIRFRGEDITRLSPNQIFDRGLSRGFQDPSLFYRLTTLDNALLPARSQIGERARYAPFRRAWAREETDNAMRAKSVLERVNLQKFFKDKAENLSGGQMKLLDIARSLMGDPSLLLLDEPTAGVAPNLAFSIFQQIKRMQSELGITFLIIEHRLDMLFNFVNRAYVMHLGKLLAQGEPAEIMANPDVRRVYFGE